MERWRVHKFGGSSVADAARIERVAEIVEQAAGDRIAVVLSACGGVTDALLALVAGAERQDPQTAAALHALERRHAELAATLLEGDALDYTRELTADCRDIRGILKAVHLTRTTSPALRDLVANDD